MFELPEAKRVRRDELHSPTSSPRSSPDPELADLLRAQLASRIDIELVDAPQPRGAVKSDQDVNNLASDDEEMEFHLFAAPAKNAANADAKAAAPQRIRIKSPDLKNGDGGCIIPKRPDSFYFSGVPDEKLRRQLESAAVTGDQVMSWAQQKWPGCVLPWKVKTITLDRKSMEVLGISGESVSAEPTTERRKRKGKRARIAIRTKLKAKAEAKEAQAKEKAEKELAERVKRAKRNRDKKLKKRQRDKLKKAAAGGQEKGQSQDEPSSDEGDDSSSAIA